MKKPVVDFSHLYLTYTADGSEQLGTSKKNKDKRNAPKSAKKSKPKEIAE